MAEVQQKSQLVVIRQAPYGSGLARAAVDAALAAAAFDQPVTLLFAGDGVLQLLSEQDGHRLGQKDHGKLLSSLPLYDIETLYADGVSLARLGIDPESLQLPVKVLDTPALQQLLLAHDHLLGC